MEVQIDEHFNGWVVLDHFDAEQTVICMAPSDLIWLAKAILTVMDRSAYTMGSKLVVEELTKPK